MIWFIGFVGFILYRVFNAGMKSQELFYVVDRFNSKGPKVFDGEKVFFYTLTTGGLAATWPLSLPAIGVFLLGKRYAK